MGKKPKKTKTARPDDPSDAPVNNQVSTLWTCRVAEASEGPLFTLRSDPHGRGGASGVTDGAAASEAAPWCELSLRGGSLVLCGEVDGEFSIHMEDTRVYREHTIQLLATPAGAGVFLDGYVVWATRRPLTVLRDAEITSHQGHTRAGGTQYAAATAAEDLADAPLHEILRNLAPLPHAITNFVAPELAPHDAVALGQMPSYALHARFRVRGPGQYGVVLAGSAGGEQTLRARIAPDGVTLHTTASAEPLHAPGQWSDGRWHHLTLAFIDGATQVWVDGWLCAHAPGRAPEFDRLTIGQDLRGERLMGEVADGGVYGPLNDQQIARLARRTPIAQVPVFDDYPGGVFHRIPALLRLADGTLLALADARHGLPNDAPNVTELVMARSTDGGATWEEPRGILGYPSDPAAPVSVTDPCAVQDESGRIHILIDLYGAGLGLLQAEPGHGLTQADGSVAIGVAADPDGTLRDGDGTDLGNLYTRGTPATEVGHIAHITSDDGGTTWGETRVITAQIKDDWMPFLGLGPGVGICLTRGNHKGRLVVPCYFSDEAIAQFSAAALISDDGGTTWRRSASTNAGRVVAGREVDERNIHDPAALMSEATVVELASGALLMFTRSQHKQVLRAVSRDAGETWGDVIEDAMSEIFCQPAATIRGDWAQADGSAQTDVYGAAARDGAHGADHANADSEVLYFANASRMLPYRGCGTLYRADGAERIARRVADGEPIDWQGRAINPRHHGYQSLAPLPGGVGMLWERETAGVWFSAIPDAIFD